MRIGVLGTGMMGAPIAAALHRAFEVRVFDIDATRRDAASAAGLHVDASASDLACWADVVITVLPGAPDVEIALAEVHQLLRPGSCWLDLSTGDPRVTRRWTVLLQESHIASVAAPMAGGPRDAGNGTLHFSVGGAPHEVAKIRPLLGVLAVEGGVEIVGTDPHAAQTIKLLSNLLWFGQVVAVTEAMLVGTALGFEPARLHDLLATRAGSSVLLTHDYGSVLRGDYLPAFGLDRVVAQLEIVTSIAEEYSVPFALSDQVERVHREALERFGPIRGELLAARILEERSGMSLRVESPPG